MSITLYSLAEQVASDLKRTQRRVVFAESCTGGMVSAVLARIPGISDFLCGSAVVYRLDTKTRWLGIPHSVLESHGAVSEVVARMMAENVLARTPESDLGVSITGHLGPDVPTNQDGLVFIGMACRDSDPNCMELRDVFSHRLPSEFPSRQKLPEETLRIQRQTVAAELVLSHLRMKLESLSP